LKKKILQWSLDMSPGLSFDYTRNSSPIYIVFFGKICNIDSKLKISTYTNN
jgi:hypothetical protein